MMVRMRGWTWPSSVLWLLLGCSADDTGTSTDDGAATVSSATATATSQPPVDCADVQLPGCMMVVEVCEAGECSCLCADAPTTGAEGTATGGDACPADALPTDPPTVCTEPATSCATIGGCCRCDVVASCGGEPVWWCVTIVPDPACPMPMPAIDEACMNEGVTCSYCDEADSPVLRTCTAGTWQDDGGLGCAG
jgi:hypothetical protein